ncbi:MAG: hypothetical protein M0R17_02520 [Candidatus Omnitrophica bacterium]|jgi:hypothetical protein|nr:hypothetical protein [Candidatus Omnitrophota bacterium]
MINSTFSYNSQIKDIQNSLISENIRSVSNFELLNSEEAIKNVISSYIDKFNSLGGMLTDISKFIVKSKDIINSKQFDDLFQSVYIDIYALYNDLNIVSNVLNLNLNRNKNYFLIIKKRIRDLWNKLNLTRSFIYDSNPSDESYYESFYNDINSLILKDVLIDKKSGYLYINPIYTETHNKSFQIKSINSVTYPEPNDNGGVYKNTNILNTFEDNYKNGPRDMLQNGLWKEEIYTNVIPELSLNIGSDSRIIQRNYKGIVSIIDIEYSYSIEFNRIDFDIFGDKSLTIDAILYKQNIDDEWNILNYENIDNLDSNNLTNLCQYSVRGSDFDVLSFYNIEKINVKFLRIVVNQEHYIQLNSDYIKNISIEDKMFNDLSERRYDIVKFNKNINSFLSSPIIDENKSLYNKIINIIESTSSIEKILYNIENLLLPKTDIVEINFSNVLKYEIGLWSIEPKLELYSYLNGVFSSNKYKLNDKVLNSISLNTKQSLPGSTTCNWYIEANNKEIPIVENTSKYRKEPIKEFDVSSYSNFSGWVDRGGIFTLLDFPIDSVKYQEIVIYNNGVLQENIINNIAFLNSRMIYINGIKDVKNNNYVIRYPLSFYKTINVYVLSSKTNNSYKYISLGIISTKKEILEAFINDIRYSVLNSDGSRQYLKDDFIVTNAVTTSDESKYWFGPSYENCLFIDRSIYNLIDTSLNYDKYSNAILIDDSKLSSNLSNLNDYFNLSSYGFSDFSIIGSVSNIAPISNIKVL